MSNDAYDFWSKNIGVVYDSKEWKAIMAKNGMAPLNLRGAAFQKFVKESVDEIQGISKEIGIIK
jgi:putative tricarboxylic transport membrane protein